MINKLSCIALMAIAVVSPLKAQDLTATYELALQNDAGIKQAEANQLATAEYRPQGIARLLPNISATGLSSRDKLYNAKFGNDYRGPSQEYWSNSIIVKLNQPLMHWDYWVQLSQSDNQIAQAEADYQVELQKLMVKTTEGYFNVLAAQDTVELISVEKQAITRELDGC